MKKLVVSIVGILALSAASANAGLIKWQIASLSVNPFNPSGSFVYDTDTGAFSAVSITGITGRHYNSAFGTANLVFASGTPGSALTFAGFPSLAQQGLFAFAGAEFIWSGSDRGKYVFGGLGSSTAVPEPSSVTLILIGFALLLLGRYVFPRVATNAH